MFEITRKKEMGQGVVVSLDVKAPEIAKKILPGQFVIIRVNETGERIPLTVADTDRSAGTLTIVVQVVGKTTALLRSLEEGDFIKDLVGPLGKPSEAKKVGKVIVVGGGTGIAILHHTTKALKAAGNHIIGIIGARDKSLLIFEDEMRALCDELVVTTDDGSYGIKGFVTQPLEEFLKAQDDVKEVFAVGPIIMMKNVCKITEKYEVPTVVSLNPIMIDGTGMCGGCRVTVDGVTKFCCVEGPEFDGHKVDFDELQKRISHYLSDEKESVLFSIRS
jgi:ferredoxin--NADP+ reductase